MRLGDILPRQDVHLVLGEEVFIIYPPSLKTLAKLEHWYEETYNEKLKWREVLVKQMDFDPLPFCQFMHIVLSEKNNLVPSVDHLMEIVNSQNWMECIMAVSNAVQRSEPENVKAADKTETPKEENWATIFQFALSRGLKYEEVWNMTFRELYAMMIENEIVDKKSMEPGEVFTPDIKRTVMDIEAKKNPKATWIHKDYDPNWLEKMRDRDRVRGVVIGFDAVAENVLAEEAVA